MYVCSDLQKGRLGLKSLRKITLTLINMRIIKVLKNGKSYKNEMYITKLKLVKSLKTYNYLITYK